MDEKRSRGIERYVVVLLAMFEKLRTDPQIPEKYRLTDKEYDKIIIKLKRDYHII